MGSVNEQPLNLDLPAGHPPVLERPAAPLRHKREFQFAIKAQEEIAASIGSSVRRRKAPPALPSGPSPSPRCRSICKKRRKTSRANNDGPRTGSLSSKAVGSRLAPSSSSVPTTMMPQADEHQEERAVPDREVGSVTGGVACDAGDSGSKHEAVQSGSKPTLEPEEPKDVPQNIRQLLATGYLEGLEVHYKGKDSVFGVVRGRKISCHCNSCNGEHEFAACEFEIHLGSRKKRPADYIYLGDMSINQLLKKWKSDRRVPDAILSSKRQSQENNTCQKNIGGECTKLSSEAPADLTSSRQEISNQCIQNERLDDLDQSGPSISLQCEKCNRDYTHQCLEDHKICDLKALLEGTGVIQELSLIVAERTAVGEGSPNYPKSYLRWTLLSGSTLPERSENFSSGEGSSDNRELLLSSVLEIFNESFSPITDGTTNHIQDIVYGKKDSLYQGTHCAVLTVGTSVVSAATLRILGAEAAEILLVATNKNHKKKGYFRKLFYCIHKFLQSLSIKHLVLSSVKKTESMWINKFDFTKIERRLLSEYTKDAHIKFDGLRMLHKQILDLKSSRGNLDTLKVQSSLFMEGFGDALKFDAFGMLLRTKYKDSVLGVVHGRKISCYCNSCNGEHLKTEATHFA